NSGALEAFHIGSCSRWPNSGARIQICALAHRVALGIVAEKPDCRVGDCGGIVKWNDHTTSIGKEFLCMPIRRRDDRFPRAERNRQSSRNNLSFLAIRRDVYIRRPDMLDHLLVADKAVVEYDIWRHATFDSERLQRFAVLFPLSTPDMRMGGTRNNINNIRV